MRYVAAAAVFAFACLIAANRTCSNRTANIRHCRDARVAAKSVDDCVVVAPPVAPV